MNVVRLLTLSRSTNWSQFPLHTPRKLNRNKNKNLKLLTIESLLYSLKNQLTYLLKIIYTKKVRIFQKIWLDLLASSSSRPCNGIGPNSSRPSLFYCTVDLPIEPLFSFIGISFLFCFLNDYRVICENTATILIWFFHKF